MVLSADDLGIHNPHLMPFFCCSCGERIGWIEENFAEEPSQVYCEGCAKEV
jgi:hypothetical protein